MSLDVYLYSRIPCPHCQKSVDTENCVHTSNITHNLGGMAQEAGIYRHLWHPEDLLINTAGELIGPLNAGLVLLRAEPERFKKLNPDNGWGSYEGFITFVEEYLRACEEYPNAKISVSR